MKQTLGKIVFFIFLSQTILLATVQLKAPQSFTQGDSVQFGIVAKGSDVKMPNITTIENYTVQTLGRSVQTHIVNGKKSSTLEQTYMFKPDKSITIPPFEVRVDGKVMRTKSQTVQMEKVEKTISNLFDFELKVDKKEVFVGEMVKLDLLFRYRKDINVVDLQFQPPIFDGFWVKQIKQNLPIKDADPNYHYQGLQYLLFPQKQGVLDIGPLSIQVVTMDSNSANSFFLTGAANKRSVYSNSITLDVKKTPNDLALVGKFEIEGGVDKTEVSQGEAVSFKVKIKGEGNMDDIPNIKLDIPEATIYENPADQNFEYKGKKYQGEYTKAFSILSSKSFTIPPVVIEYFDPTTNKTHTIKTQKYTINVKSPTTSNTPTLQIENKTDQKTSSTSKEDKLLYFLLGVVSIVVVLFLFIVIQKLFTMKKSKKQKELPLYKKLANANSKNEILKIVAVYINIDKDFDKIIYEFEQTEDTKVLKHLQKQMLQQIKQMNKKGIL